MKRIFGTCILFIAVCSACQTNGGEVEQTIQEPQQTQVVGGSKALIELDSLVASQPNNPAVYYRRARLQTQLNNPEAALSDLEKAKSLNDTLEYIYLAEAELYLTTDNPLMGFPDSKLAIQSLERYLEKKPESIRIQAELARIHSIVTQFKESNEILSDIMKLEPTEAKWRFFLGNNLREMGDTASALQAYQRAIELNPEFVDAYSEAGYLMERQQNELAVDMYRNSLRIDPTDPLVQFNLATCLHNFKRFEEAVAEFKRVIELEAQNPAAFYNLGLVYYDMDNMEEAKRSFENAIKMAPDLVNGYYMLAITHELLGDYSRAIQMYKTTLNLDPEFLIAQKALNDLLQTVQANS